MTPGRKEELNAISATGSRLLGKILPAPAAKRCKPRFTKFA
jgi:hypothetical protein